HGADPDPAAIDACRALLLARLGGVAGEALPALAPDLHVGRPEHGLADRADLARALVGTPGAAGALRRLAEEAEALGRVDRAVRRAYLAGEADTARLARDLAALAPRRDALARELDRVAARAAGLDLRTSAARAWVRDRRPVHPLAALAPFLVGGGALLVRRAPCA